ncbi:MAG: hypothetical protein JSV35_07880 [Candidatus Bathyarchaeota archaeon]|nr:MAG: hypothetical protein JSV35_07880 [Candidatus Bathyarchaeota archaeon]
MEHETLIWMDYPSMFVHMKALASRPLAVLTILSALCLAIQLTPRPLPNVEFTSLLVFIVGSFFGGFIGCILGSLVMLANGFLSPWGLAGLMLPFQILGMGLVGFAGGLYGKTKKNSVVANSIAETGILGAFLTLVYDIITNFGVSVSLMLTGVAPLPAIITSLISGAPFSLIHVGSNLLIFSATFFPLTRAMEELIGGEPEWRSEPLPT